MQVSKLILVTVSLAFSLIAAELRAGLIIDVGIGASATYSVGETIRVPFAITVTGGDQIAAYSLAVDLGTSGLGGTSGFSNIHADFSTKQIGDFSSTDDGTIGFFNNALAGQLDAADPAFTGNISFDYVVSNGQSNNATPGTSFRLFELVFKANTAGTFAVNAVVRTDPGNLGFGDVSAFTFIGLGPTNYDLNSTSISSNNFSFIITSVPEPSSMTLVGLVVTGLCLVRCRCSSRLSVVGMGA